MRAPSVALLLVLSAPLFAADHWFEPAAPTSQTFIELHYRGASGDACVPRQERIVRSGNTIDVFWERPAGCSGVSVPTPWGDDAAIGVLPAGVYEVRVHVESAPPMSVPLIVTEGAPELVVDPSMASVSGGETIVIFRESEMCTPPSSVTIGGVAAPVVSSGCAFARVTAPPHAAGAADVTATFGGETHTVRAGLRYVDPAAAPDDSAFQRVLLPILYEGEGAYGSRWVTEGTIFPTATERPLVWMHDVVNAECLAGPCSGEAVELMRFGNHPAGLLLFVPRGLGDFEAKLFARDVSREREAWGAQVPVVREKDFVRGGAMHFPNVPFTGPYRALLRIYGVDAASSHVTVFAGDRVRTVTLAGPCGFHVTPCNSARPAFAAVDLRETFPELDGGRHTVVVMPAVQTALRYWAFVSITNNETQHVSLLTP